MRALRDRRRVPLMLTWLSLAACSSLTSFEAPRRPFDVQGHRGARGLLPENTLEGFKRALELGVSTLELDLGVTRDRELVVAHDRRINPKICRRGDGTTILTPPLLRELSLAEVRALDCGGLNPDRRRFPEQGRCGGGQPDGKSDRGGLFAARFSEFRPPRRPDAGGARTQHRRLDRPRFDELLDRQRGGRCEPLR